MPLRAIFFDAGGTLIFPSLERTLAPLAALGLCPAEEQLLEAERAAKHYLDATWMQTRKLPPDYWDFFFTHLLRSLGSDNGSLKPELIAAVCVGTNWQRVQPGTQEVLRRLERRFRLGVISNSDGSIRQALANVGLADRFDSITDSGVVGHEKPSPEIFRAALASLAVQPQESLYVGDIYSIDVVGATQVGMEAVLMDVAGVYRDSPYARIQSLSELETFLAEN